MSIWKRLNLRYLTSGATITVLVAVVEAGHKWH